MDCEPLDVLMLCAIASAGFSHLAHRSWVAKAGVLTVLFAQATIGCSPTPSGQANAFATAAHVPYPQIPTGGGPTLGSAQVVTVSFAGDAHSADLTTFVDWMCQSQWPSVVGAEYGVGSVAHRADIVLAGLAPSVLTDDDVRTLLLSRIADGTLPSAPPVGASFLYMIFFPDGVDVTHLSGDACAANPGNGYHDMTDGAGSNVPYVVVPACEPRFSALLSEVEGMQLEAARLLIDALTDPSPRNEPAYALTDDSNPWTALGAEVGDFCWGRLVGEGPGYTVQRVWSNKEAAAGGEPCLPAPHGSVPFGIAASPPSLQTLDVGVAFDWVVTGWSRAPVADWSIQAISPWAGDFAITATLDRDTLNDGQTAALRVTVPYAVPSGTYGAVLLRARDTADAPLWPVAFTVR
jgi:hypothetical protein